MTVGCPVWRVKNSPFVAGHRKMVRGEFDGEEETCGSFCPDVFYEYRFFAAL